MNKRKYYIGEDSELYYHLECFLNEMKENKIDKIQVEETIIDHNNRYRWCNKNDIIIENDAGCCGKDCEYYNPKNGKNGCCIHLTYCYNYGDKYVLYSNDRLEKINK